MTASNHSKSCSKCNRVLSLDNFHKRENNRYRSQCKSCMNAASAMRASKNNPVTPTSKICGKCSAEKTSTEFHKTYRSHDGLASNCKDCKKQYDSENKMRFIARKQSAPTATAEYRRVWNNENALLKRSYTANRRAMIKMATPLFADARAIRDVYLNCPDGHEVDHIIPINSPIVCGLHVHWNMQYLTRADNIKKGNRL